MWFSFLYFLKHAFDVFYREKNLWMNMLEKLWIAISYMIVTGCANMKEDSRVKVSITGRIIFDLYHCITATSFT